MKTIEEAASEYSKIVSPHSKWTAKNAQISFKAGVEFAQRWISVKDELPENRTDVIVRDSELRPNYSVALYDDGFICDFYLTNETVTHWRPINLV